MSLDLLKRSDLYTTPGYRDAAAAVRMLDKNRTGADVKAATGVVTVASTDPADTIYMLHEISPTAILRPETTFKCDNFQYASVDIGLVVIAQNTPQTLTRDGLYSGALSAGLKPITQFGAKWGQELWAPAGLSSWINHHSVHLCAFGPAGATPSAAGDLHFDIVWQDM